MEIRRRKSATLHCQKEAADVAPLTGTTKLGVKIEGGDRILITDKVAREAGLEETQAQVVPLLANSIILVAYNSKSNINEVTWDCYSSILSQMWMTLPILNQMFF